MMKRALQLPAIVFFDLLGAARITANPFAFWRLATDLCSCRLIGRVNSPSFLQHVDRQRRVRLRNGVTLFYRFNKGDLHAIREIWFGEGYRLPPQYSDSCFYNQTLVDLGANIGMTALWLARRYSFSRVIAVEPVAENLRLVEKNLRGNGIEVHGLEAAATARDGSVLFSDSSSSTNGLVLSAIDGAIAGRKVRAAGMSTILATLPPAAPLPLLKIDIEGGEADLLGNGAPLDWLERAQNLIIEVHPTRVDYHQLQKTLEEHGLKRVRTERAHPRGEEIEVLEFYARA
jgi:FkbM family methyltransferase